MRGVDANLAYRELTPERVLAAVEASGVRADGRILALNSYENRVYQVGIEDGAPLVAKFYRPGRWPDAAIEEEHAFAAELAAAELPVIAPLADGEGRTLRRIDAFRFALFPRRGGRWPDLEAPGRLERLGRLLGRLHAVGAAGRFAHRPRLTVQRFGVEARGFVLEHGFVPDYLRPAYTSVSAELLAAVEAAFEACRAQAIRLHGDCHPGNVLWAEDEGPAFVDLDDAVSGPAVQDLWMLLSGPRVEREAQLAALLEGYSAFRGFDPLELALIEPLRALRLIHYAAWLARRWSDPAFPHHFPWFNTPRWWEEQVLALREQLATLAEPPLAP